MEHRSERISLVGCVVAAALLFGADDAHALKARSYARWVFSDPSAVFANGNAGTGSYTLGRDVVSIAGIGTSVAPSRTAGYAAWSLAGPNTLSALLVANGTSTFAQSTMTIGAPVGASYPWSLFLRSDVSRTTFSPTGSAIARGSDPDFFDPVAVALQPLYEEMVTLSAGASVFEEDASDEAYATMDRVSSLLADPIFSIALFGSSTGPLDAVVFFNPDPRLVFSMTAGELEALLELPSSGLGTFDGSLSDLGFSYAWDLSSFAVTAADTIGGGGVAFAASVPEAGVPMLLAVGMIGLAIARRGRRA